MLLVAMKINLTKGERSLSTVMTPNTSVVTEVSVARSGHRFKNATPGTVCWPIGSFYQASILSHQINQYRSLSSDYSVMPLSFIKMVMTSRSSVNLFIRLATFCASSLIRKTASRTRTVSRLKVLMVIRFASSSVGK